MHGLQGLLNSFDNDSVNGRAEKMQTPALDSPMSSKPGNATHIDS